MSLNQNSSFQQIIDVINSLPVNPKPGATGNAQPADVLAPKTFSNIDNINLVGTMPNRAGHVNAQSSSVNGTTLRLRPQAGYYDGTTGNSVQLSNANFVANNIKEGVNLFGITGTLTPMTSTDGNISVPSFTFPGTGIDITGLSFRPNMILCFLYENNNLLSSGCRNNTISSVSISNDSWNPYINNITILSDSSFRVSLSFRSTGGYMSNCTIRWFAYA